MSDVAVLSQYFDSFGLVSLPPQPDHLSFQVHGNASQVQRALGVSLNSYVDSRGDRFYATSNDPQLPSNLAGPVQAIFGLDSYPSFHPQHATSTNATISYEPYQLQDA
jgi:subtilase family serine protease